MIIHVYHSGNVASTSCHMPVSTASAAWIAAEIMPVCQTMSVFAQLRATKSG